MILVSCPPQSSQGLFPPFRAAPVKKFSCFFVRDSDECSQRAQVKCTRSERRKRRHRESLVNPAKIADNKFSSTTGRSTDSAKPPIERGDGGVRLDNCWTSHDQSTTSKAHQQAGSSFGVVNAGTITKGLLSALLGSLSASSATQLRHLWAPITRLAPRKNRDLQGSVCAAPAWFINAEVLS